MNMKKKYESPVSIVIAVIQSSVVCASFDTDHRTEILLLDDEETI